MYVTPNLGNPSELSKPEWLFGLDGTETLVVILEIVDIDLYNLEISFLLPPIKRVLQDDFRRMWVHM